MEYYIMMNGVEIGPMTAHQMMAYSPNEQTPVKTAADEQWRPLLTYPELMSMLHGEEVAGSSKEHVVAGILAILVGTLGIQYFYVGKTTAGILTILISIVTCGLWGVITLIQGILMLIMSQQEFDSKYVDSKSTFPIF